MYNVKRSLFKVRSVFLPLVIVFIMVMLVVFPDRYVGSTFTGVKIWALNVLPSLLPFFFLTALLSGTGNLIKTTAALSPVTRFLYKTDGLTAYAQIMSFLSGYPIGVKIAADMYNGGLTTSRNVTKMSAFCSTSGPLFIVGSVGTAMFGNKTAGLIMLAAHLLSSVLCGVLFRFLPYDNAIKALEKGKTPDNVLYESIYSAVISVALVGGFIAIFYTFASILSDIGVFTPLTYLLSPVIGGTNAEGVALGLIECTFACRKFAEKVTPLSVSLACGAISFGGLSVWCQSLIYLNKAHADIKIFALSKLLHTALSFLICYAAGVVLL